MQSAYQLTKFGVFAMYTLAIIGGGSAGVSALYQLVEFFSKHTIQEKPKILLIEKSEEVGPGLAYGKSANDAYLLNIISSKMSPIPHQPDHFDKWLKDSNNVLKWRLSFPNLDIESSEYLPRKLFGIYLTDLAIETQKRAKLYNIEVEFIHAEVVNIIPNEINQLKIQLKDQTETLLVDSAVLCIGHLPPSQIKYKEFNSITEYYKTPWDIKAHEISIDKDFLILGTRLTAIDAILARAEYIKQRIQQGYKGNVGKIIAVSHTGLFPRVISDVTQSYVRNELTLEAIDSVTAYGTESVSLAVLKKMFKAEIRRAYKIIREKEITFKVSDIIKRDLESSPRELLEHEIDCAKRHVQRPWQTVLFSLYPIVPRLWEALDEDGKKEFLEKYHTFWMTYLAAFPVDNAEKILSLLKGGLLETYSGLEKVSYNTESKLFKVNLRDGKYLQGEYLVNATGQGHDITQADSPLLQNLLTNGYIKPHALGGIEVDFKSLRVIGKNNNIPLFIVGDPTWGACMATADLSQIVNNQIPRVINSILKPLKTKYQMSLLISNSSNLFSVIVKGIDPLHSVFSEEKDLSTSPNRS